MAVKKLIVLFTVTVIFGACRKMPKTYTAEDIPSAQTTPPDMVYVQAGGDLPSFYMGVTEECNINHEIYTDWLKYVFADYPEVIEMAQPKSRDVSHLLRFNDPYYSYYQNHEAFAYYPVTGLTWVQAMSYLQWKSDRLNEFILMDLELSDKSDITNQVAGNNFATEAYLSGQYYPVTKNELPDLEPGGTTRKVRYDDGILFPTMRLPTEAEWDYALANMPEKPIDPANYADPFSKDAMYPYGKEYYTFLVGRERGFEFDYFFKKGFEYHYNYNTIPTIPDRLTGPADYDLSKPGIANMKGNVHEWLFDKYSDDKQYKNNSFINYFSEWCMPLPADSLIYDPDGHYLEKDSLGRMYFNIFGIPQADSKKPLRFRRYKQVLSRITGYELIYVDSTKNRIEPGNYNIARRGEINFLKYYKSRCYGNDNNYFADWVTLPEEDTSKIPLYFDMPAQNFMQVDTMLYLQSNCYGSIYREYIVRSLFKNDTGYYYKVPVYEYIKYDTAVSYRLIKGGNWKQPDGNYRQKMR
ncbi:MAG TPA: SUMF1/EgtB/PvdO family nonheme iron enzyme, partial [Bacteroidia bacterium]|nr:SUMF1/EgtB/PvdO family nonheme iron enzyme [Bacteroidia bacterium]